jgi:hypothetical protein
MLSHTPKLSWFMRALSCFIALCCTLGVLGGTYFLFRDGELFQLAALGMVALVSLTGYVSWFITIRGTPPSFLRSTMRKLYPNE